MENVQLCVCFNVVNRVVGMNPTSVHISPNPIEHEGGGGGKVKLLFFYKYVEIKLSDVLEGMQYQVKWSL